MVVERLEVLGTTLSNAYISVHYFFCRITWKILSPRLGNLADGRLRHAFIGIGFRERTEAYDFQAALHDHMKYP